MAGKEKSLQAKPIRHSKTWMSLHYLRGATLIQVVWIWKKAREFQCISHSLIREIVHCLVGPALIPAIYQGRLYVINASTKEYASVELSESQYNKNCFYPLDGLQALCWRYMAEVWVAYLLKLDNLSLERLDGHIASSTMPICCWHFNYIYVFRACSRQNESCSFPKKAWWTFPDVTILDTIKFAFPVKHFIYIGLPKVIWYHLAAASRTFSSSSELQSYLF